MFTEPARKLGESGKIQKKKRQSFSGMSEPTQTQKQKRPEKEKDHFKNNKKKVQNGAKQKKANHMCGTARGRESSTLK